MKNKKIYLWLLIIIILASMWIPWLYVLSRALDHEIGSHQPVASFVMVTFSYCIAIYLYHEFKRPPRL